MNINLDIGAIPISSTKGTSMSSSDMAIVVILIVIGIILTGTFFLYGW